LALEKADVLQRHPAPDKWLYKTANTLSKEMLRKDKHVKKNEVFVEDIETHSVSIPLEEEVQAFVMRAKAEAVDIGKFLNDTLTPDEHRLYQLRYYEKCRTGQIAELLGIRHSAARVRLARLKAKVDRAVKKYLHE
jgi:RNA polymerase sigma factor (sigma-70 family)